MSSASAVNGSPDYLQYLNAQMPSFPGQPGANPQGTAGAPSLAQLLAILGTNPSAADATPGVAGAGGAAAAAAARTPGAAQAAAARYTRDGANSHLPPPRAPRTTMTPNTASAYDSLSNELAAVQGNVQQRMSARPDANTTMAPFDYNGTNEQGAQHATDMLSHVINNVQEVQGDTMTEFMALRIKNGTQGLKELGELSDLCNDVQNSQLKEQEAKSREADKEATKAAKKAAQMGIFNKFLTVLMAIVTAFVAVFTLGTGLGLMCVAAAALIAFIAGGAAKGKGKGGFDVMGGLEIATYAADAAIMVVGIGTVLIAAQQAMKDAAKGVAIAVTEQMAKQLDSAVAKNVGKSLAEAAPKAMINEARNAGFTVTEKAMEEAGIKQTTKAVLKTAASSGTKGATNSVQEVTREQLLSMMRRQLSERTKKEVKQFTADEIATKGALATVQEGGTEMATLGAKAKSAEFLKLFKKHLTDTFASMGGQFGEEATSTLGKTLGKIIPQDFGTRMMTLGLLTAGVQGGGALANSGMQYAVTQHQTNAEESQAIIKLLDATVQMCNGQYSTLQNTMNTLQQSHSKAVDSIQSILRNTQQANLMISNNFTSR